VIDRRTFLTAAAVAAAGSQMQIADAAAESPPVDLGDDPLGVRGDFPTLHLPHHICAEDALAQARRAPDKDH
jgi:hypothetical protein